MTMKAIGIVVEYNPFHNGHMYQINEARKVTKAECVIAVMSPNFVMRGEPAILDKFERTEIALNNGIDIVLELPTVFAIQASDIFASKAIDILNTMEIECLCFGAETDDLKILQNIADTFEKEEYLLALKKYLKIGLSFQAASKKAINDVLPDASSIITMPNNILAIQYLRHLKKLSRKIKPVLIKRVGNEYYDEHINIGDIQSATAIRKLMINNEDFSTYVPKYANYQGFVSLKDFFPFIAYKIYSSSKEDLKEIFGVSEGLENSLKDKKIYQDIDDFFNTFKSKRYTESRLKRLLLCILLNIKKSDVQNKSIEYIKVLGFNKIGQQYLNWVKKTITLPILTKVHRDEPKMHQKEILYSKIYSLVSRKNTYYREYYQPIIIKQD